MASSVEMRLEAPQQLQEGNGNGQNVVSRKSTTGRHASMEAGQGKNFYVQRRPIRNAGPRNGQGSSLSPRPRMPVASAVTMSLDSTCSSLSLAGTAPQKQPQQRQQQQQRGRGRLRGAPGQLHRDLSRERSQERSHEPNRDRSREPEGRGQAVPPPLNGAAEQPPPQQAQSPMAPVTGGMFRPDVRRRSLEYASARREEDAVKLAYKGLYEGEEKRDIEARHVQRLVEELEKAQNELEEVEEETNHLRASIDVRKKELADAEEDLTLEQLYKEVMEGPPVPNSGDENGTAKTGMRELTPEALQAIILDLRDSIYKRRKASRATSDGERASLQQQIEKLRLDVEVKQTHIRNAKLDIEAAQEEKLRLHAQSRQLEDEYAEEEKDLEMLTHDIERARQLSAQERGARRRNGASGGGGGGEGGGGHEDHEIRTTRAADDDVEQLYLDASGPYAGADVLMPLTPAANGGRGTPRSHRERSSLLLA